MDKKKRIRLLAAALSAAAALGVGALSLYLLWERPPERAVQQNAAAQLVPAPTQAPATQRPAPTPSPTPERGTAFDTARQDGVYTLLVAVSDDGTGNTDAILVGKLDTVRHTADFVSLPRDTLINVDTPIRKLNSVYWGAVNSGGVGSDTLLRHIRKLVGFDVDCYAVFSLEAFEQAVDALGGIWYEVPERMYYDRGPVIDLEPGLQRLSGEQAMWLCRYRSGYVNGDIDRIAVQQDFMRAACEQFLQLGTVPELPKVAAIVADGTDTNMSSANLAWFARQLLRCRSEDIRFCTAPNTPAYVQDISYTFLNLYDWLRMINERLNPSAVPVTEAQLDLVYLYNGAVCCTGVLQGVGYFDLGRGRGEPEPAPEPEPEPVWTPAPRPAAPPSPSDWIEPEPAEPEAPAEPAATVPPFLAPIDDSWLTEE